jgi:hypothetical protein
MSEENSNPVGDATGQSEQSESNEQSTHQNPMLSEAEKLAKKYKVKIDGQEMEVDEGELLSNYQLKKASDQRFQQGMQARKQAEEFIRLLKTDPVKVLSHPSIGLDVKKWAEELLINEMQEAQMSPEEKQLREYKEKLARYEEQEQLLKRQQEEQQKEAVKSKYREEYNKQIISALDSSGLPKTEYTVQRMIHYMAKALQAEYELSASDVVDLVRRDYINDTKALYSGLDAEALVKILGDDVAKKLRKSELDKLKNPIPGRVPTNAGVAPQVGKKENKMSKEEWRSYLENLK